ncbi:MAG: type II secretion system GspH family protein [Pseudomonadales bacterium]|nr:type II secretion system GspH family protein [Pseudomonadales bacterium]
MSFHTRMSGGKGFSLIEMLVSLTILGILASVTIPYAEVAIKRQQEAELRQSLRIIRTAIDEFHRDWSQEAIVRADGNSSRTGYPKTLDVLLEGVELTGSQEIKKYLRRLPQDPLAENGLPVEQHWALRSSQDDPQSTIWGGEDVYDVTVNHDRVALDGSNYREW